MDATAKNLNRSNALPIRGAGMLARASETNADQSGQSGADADEKSRSPGNTTPLPYRSLAPSPVNECYL
jgi:hypothetical protein